MKGIIFCDPLHQNGERKQHHQRRLDGNCL